MLCKMKPTLYAALIQNGCLAGLGGGLVFSMVWMLVLRLCAGFIVWFTVLASNFLLLAVALYCYSKAGLITASGAVGKVTSSFVSGFVLGHPWHMLAAHEQSSHLAFAWHCHLRVQGREQMVTMEPAIPVGWHPLQTISCLEIGSWQQMHAQAATCSCAGQTEAFAACDTSLVDPDAKLCTQCTPVRA